MSAIPSLTPHRFEQFPDEILLEFFKYLEAVDLHSFAGLNQRIDNVIRDTKLNIVIGYQDLDYLTNFLPNQFVRLEVRCDHEGFDLNVFKEIRSLTLDQKYLSKTQLDQLFTVNLPYLERLCIDSVPFYNTNRLLLTILDNEHFPSLKVFKFLGNADLMVEFDGHYQSSNTTVRTLILNKWNGSHLGSLLRLLPNLNRFETTCSTPINGSLNSIEHHTSLKHLRLTLDDLYNDLEEILHYTPNLKQLRVTGKITEDSALIHFEKLAKIFHSQMHYLQKFDCELYFYAWTDQVDIIIIQQLHPLFKTIKCHSGEDINRCYTTDLTEYPSYSEFSYADRTRTYTTMYSGVMREYDSDEYYDHDNDDYDDGWIDYGLGYRENYRRNYGGSPWDGNNDDD